MFQTYHESLFHTNNLRKTTKWLTYMMTNFEADYEGVPSLMLLPGEAMPTCHQYTLKEQRQHYDLTE